MIPCTVQFQVLQASTEPMCGIVTSRSVFFGFALKPPVAKSEIPAPFCVSKIASAVATFIGWRRSISRMNESPTRKTKRTERSATTDASRAAFPKAGRSCPRRRCQQAMPSIRKPEVTNAAKSVCRKA